MDYVVYVLFAVLVLWIGYKQFAPVKGLKTMHTAEFKKLTAEHKVIDVREAYEHQQGHITGSVNIPLGQIAQRIHEIPKDKPVYLYCRSGMRSKQAGKVLSKNGYSNIAHLSGGIMAWDGPLKK